MAARFSDSKSVARWLSAEQKLEPGALPPGALEEEHLRLYLLWQGRALRLPQGLSWVRRGRNRAADRLVN